MKLANWLRRFLSKKMKKDERITWLLFNAWRKTREVRNDLKMELFIKNEAEL